ncbi:MAG: hypothetical protein ACLR2E_23260 [Lachnospiraceae bacterium]
MRRSQTWKDFEYFLEERCFPKTRDHAKEILKELGLPFMIRFSLWRKRKAMWQEISNGF